MLPSSQETISITIAGRTFPLDNDFIAKELFWSGVDCYADGNPQRSALANFFAESADYRLREIAAQSKQLTRKSALRLSKDVCYSVRNYISQNSQALELLSAKALLMLGQSDHTIAANLVNPFTPFDQATRKSLAAKLIGHYAKGEAFKLQDILTSLKQQPRKRRLTPQIDSTEENKRHVEFDSYDEGVATLNWSEHQVALASEEVTVILDYLKTNAPKFSQCISKLLTYPDADVLDYVAQHIVTNPKHLETLLATQSRRIGRTVLNNEAASKISSHALKAFLGSDVAMIEDVLTSEYDVLQTRIAQIYRQDDNPAIREVIERFDAAMQEHTAWLNSDDDELEDDSDDDFVGTVPMPPNGICGDDDENYEFDDDEDNDDDIDDSVGTTNIKNPLDVPIKPEFIL